jgi:hypothetical protein
MIEAAEAAEVAVIDSLDDWRYLNAFRPLLIMVIKVECKQRLRIV